MQAPSSIRQGRRVQPRLIPAFFEAAARDLYNVAHPRTGRIDTFLVSYQKCGRTWLELMLAQCFAELYGLGGADLSRELPKMQARAGQGPVIFSTHDWSETTGEHRMPVSPYLMLAYPVRLRYFGRRVLMLIRDPRDTIVSSFYQVTQRAYRPLPFTDIDAYALDPLYGFPRIVRFYRQWAVNRRLPAHFKLVRYESLRLQGPAALADICDFVDLGGLPAKSLEKIYAASTMERVRQLEATGGADLFRFAGPNASKARRGVVGSHRDELRPATVRQLNAWMADIPEPFAYEA